MKILFGRLALIAFGALTGWTIAFLLIVQQAPNNKTTAEHSYLKKNIIHNNISIDEQMALRGDMARSTKIVERLILCQRSSRNSAEDCIREMDYWSHIDGENGSAAGASALYQSLLGSNDCRDINRSIFWWKNIIKTSSQPNIWNGEIDKINNLLKKCGSIPLD
ncbi:hypothetical protein J2W22_003395 [Sphingomonas kyeonggiensis]|uniref:hypothetical protein n=1 Tax=Sphingomonas kyeonggiensis TaxID=1268553 RepID=UPI0027806539|nr:hypothetical protein [Sphingomonas kyeonggiensis]MDQ0251331.1 hypothetical protein [Sphingomonas kyeonggiensis]